MDKPTITAMVEKTLIDIEKLIQNNKVSEVDLFSAQKKIDYIIATIEQPKFFKRLS